MRYERWSMIPMDEDEDAMALKTLSYKALLKDEGRLDKVVAGLTGFSRTRTRGLLLHGGVSLRGEKTADAGAEVREGDDILVEYDTVRQYRDPPKSTSPQAQSLPVLTSKKNASSRNFQIIYSDETLVVVHKESGLLTVQTNKMESQNLLDLLTKAVYPGRRARLGLVHRLDRDTSGLLVFGQSDWAAAELIKQFSDRKPERVYYAIVKGHVKEDKATIRTYLKSDKALNQRSQANGDGELAITHYEVVDRSKAATLVRVVLETGRRNQIRVHFAEMGHPILGDERYEKERAMHPDWRYKRLALHAAVLGFIHPKSGEAMRFEQKLPREFLAFHPWAIEV